MLSSEGITLLNEIAAKSLALIHLVTIRYLLCSNTIGKDLKRSCHYCSNVKELNNRIISTTTFV